MYYCGIRSPLFLPSDNTNICEPFSILSKMPSIKSISCGWEFAYVVLEDGSLVAWGDNTYGQVANDTTQPKPYVLEDGSIVVFRDLPKIKKVACGWAHTLIISECGQAFSIGWNHKGQCGVDPSVFPTLNSFHKITFPQNTPIFVDCAAGNNHSLLVDDKGHVYTFGDNTYGQLGLGLRSGKKPVSIPQKIESCMIGSTVKGIAPILKVSAGAHHSLLIDAQNMVYSFGWGGYSQLGHGNTQDQTMPKFMDFGEKTLQVVAGTWHTLLLSETGLVYSCGWGKFGQLGHGNDEGANEPTPLEYLQHPDLDISIIDIKAGERHSVLLDENGVVYTFGFGKYGQLGLSSFEDKFTPSPIKWTLTNQVSQIATTYWGTFLKK